MSSDRRKWWECVFLGLQIKEEGQSDPLAPFIDLLAGFQSWWIVSSDRFVVFIREREAGRVFIAFWIVMCSVSEPSVFIKPIEAKDISKQSRVCSLKQSKTFPSSDWLVPGTPSATRSTSGTQTAAGSTAHSLPHPSQTTPSSSGSPSTALCTHRPTHNPPIQS